MPINSTNQAVFCGMGSLQTSSTLTRWWGRQFSFHPAADQWWSVVGSKLGSHLFCKQAITIKSSRNNNKLLSSNDPTMTHQSDTVSNLYHLNLDLFIAFDILSGICWHSIWQSISLSGIYSDVTYFTYFLAYILTVFLAIIQAFYLICLAIFLASSLTIFWHSVWHSSIWHSVWHPLWHEFGSRPTPQHPKLAIWRSDPGTLHSILSSVSRACSTVKEEGIRRKEEGGIYRDPHLAGEEQSINQPDSQTIAGYFHSSVAFVGSVHHFGWSRHFWDIPGI